MGQIFVAMLAGVCSREAGQLRLWSDWKILSDEVTEGRSYCSVRVDEDRVEEYFWLCRPTVLACGLRRR